MFNKSIITAALLAGMLSTAQAASQCEKMAFSRTTVAKMILQEHPDASLNVYTGQRAQLIFKWLNSPKEFLPVSGAISVVVAHLPHLVTVSVYDEKDFICGAVQLSLEAAKALPIVP